MARKAFTSDPVETHPVLPILAGTVFLLAIGIFWGGLVADQMPCFLGVPNCD